MKQILITKRILIVLILCAIPIVTTGCWDRREIERTAWVTALGFDQAKIDKRFVVHQMIARSSQLAAGPANIGGQNEKAFFVTSEKSYSLRHAVSGPLEFVARRPKYSHVGNLVVGETVARAGIEPIIAYVVRQRELRPFAWVTVGRPSALEILQGSTELERLPSNALLGLMEETASTGTAFGVSLLDAAIILLDNKRDLVLPIVERTSPRRATISEDIPPSDNPVKKQMHVVGMALFQEDRMTGVLDGFEARGLAWALGKGQGVVVIPFENRFASVDLRRVRPRYQLTAKDDELRFLIHVDVIGDLAEDQDLRLLEIQEFSQISSQTEAMMAALMRQALTKAQTMNADVLGIADLVSQEYPSLWETFRKEWAAMYPRIGIDVSVSAKITSAGLVK